MRPLVLNPLFASLTSLPGVGPKLEKLYARLLDREVPRVVDLLFHLPTGRHRPPRAAQIARRAARPGGHRRGDRRTAPGAAAAPLARALPHLCLRRYRHAHAHIFQRAQGLPGEAPAGGRAALRLRHRRILRRHVADGASRPRGGRGGLCQPAAGRAGLSAHRGLGARQCAARDGRRARPPARSAGMAGRGLGRARAFSRFRRRAAPSAPAGRAARHRARESGLDAARLSTNCSPASSRSRWCARICAGRPAAVRPAKAACARAS